MDRCTDWGVNVVMMANRLGGFSDNFDDIHRRLKEKWETEPDLVSLVHGKYHLVIWRHDEFGQLNGYVGVRHSHPCYGKDMHNRSISNLYVHGGITFTEKLIRDGFKKNLWYIGFDTAHAFDYAPRLERIKDEMRESGDPFMEMIDNLFSNFSNVVQMPMGKNLYKDIDFVSKEVVSLQEQLVAIAEKNLNVRRSHKKEYRELHKRKMRQRNQNLYTR